MKSLIPVVLLFVLLISILYKRLFQGVSFSDLRKTKINSDVLESIPIMILTVDRSGVILAVHSLPADLAGEIDSECSGKNWCEFIHRDYHSVFLNSIENTSVSGDSHSYHYEVRKESGLILHEGQITRISQDKLLMCIKDVTENLIVHEKLDLVRTSERMTTFVLDVDLMILTFDREDFLSNLSGKNISKEMKLQDVLSLFPAWQGKNMLSTMDKFFIQFILFRVIFISYLKI